MKYVLWVPFSPCKETDANVECNIIKRSFRKICLSEIRAIFSSLPMILGARVTWLLPALGPVSADPGAGREGDCGHGHGRRGASET